MPRNDQALSGQELRKLQDENQDSIIRFRVTTSMKRFIEQEIQELGVKDLSSFARGALLNALELAKLGQDPKWQEFIKTVNLGPAQGILGHGLALPGVSDIEGRGRERKGLSAEELKRKLSKGHKKGVPVA